ncbi:hypothetical protein RUM44_004024 [Polyplax serrata]|uniref:Uncharacterized protein n=1 Tax=Polyplax serrata TaxID=468196 RepID=A0ABR1B2C8_POLSC
MFLGVIPPKERDETQFSLPWLINIFLHNLSRDVTLFSSRSAPFLPVKGPNLKDEEVDEDEDEDEENLINRVVYVRDRESSSNLA